VNHWCLVSISIVLRVSWQAHAILAPRRLRHDHHQFEASLDYYISRLFFFKVKFGEFWQRCVVE
jgi:hypothetical protein